MSHAIVQATIDQDLPALEAAVERLRRVGDQDGTVARRSAPAPRPLPFPRGRARRPYDFLVPDGDMSPPPGWYPDPGGSAAYRWWTGQEWSGHLAAGGANLATAAASRRAGGRRSRGLRIATIVAVATVVLAIPLNGVFLVLAQRASQTKLNCAPLSRLQADPTFVVPALFGGAALFCLLVGIDTIISARRRSDPFARDDGVRLLVFSIVGLLVAVVSLAGSVVIVGFSTWCF
jgi:hypothetical protein